jgi:hypothetical protein
MNCQDISRIVDTGSIRKLGEDEVGAAEAHARTCRECAAIWGVQSRLANVHVPATPPEVAMRFQMLVASPAPAPARGRAMRRLTLIGGLVALAAAAGVWIWLSASWRTPQSVAAVPSSTAIGQAVLPASQSSAPAKASRTEAEAPYSTQLPLVPEPAALEQDPAKEALALRKAVELHPELVEGQALGDDAFLIVSLVMRADGLVLSSAAEQASNATVTETMNRMQGMLPSGGGEYLYSSRAKGQQLPGGTARARIFIHAMIIREGFDMARSNVRVREIVGHKYDDLALPHTSEEANMVTVFLSDDGRILRERVDRPKNRDDDMGLIASDQARRQAIAARLGIDVEQIGAIGSTTLDRGSMKVVADANGFTHLEDARSLLIRYAWERRSGETLAAPAPDSRPADEEDFDTAAALIVARRYFPDAFVAEAPARADFSTPIPTVVFTPEGEVVRAGRVMMRSGVSTDLLLAEQLVPGMHTGLDRFVRLTDSKGASAWVLFAWEEKRR